MANSMQATFAEAFEQLLRKVWQRR